jgi:hypothetical protein
VVSCRCDARHGDMLRNGFADLPLHNPRGAVQSQQHPFGSAVSRFCSVGQWDRQ